MVNIFLYLLGATIAAWLFLWRRIGDKWGWLGLANAWAEWGIYLLVGVGIATAFRKDKWVGVSLLGAATGTIATRRITAARHSSTPAIPTTDTPFTVLSANLFKRNPSIAQHIALIRTHNPDIICLQEFSPHFAAELLESVGDDYPYRALRPEKGSYGYGVVSRYPVVETGYWDRPGIKAWGQRVQVTLPSSETIEIYNVHLFPPMADEAFVNGITWSFRAREGQLGVIESEMEARGLPAMVIGDCNFNDTSNAYRQAQALWTDSWRVAGRGSRYTWPTLAFPTKRIRYNPRMLRLDYCFHNAQLRTHAFQVLTERTGSDHSPLLVTLAVTA